MKFTEFATLVRYYTKTNVTTFTDAEILLLANLAKDDIAQQIGKKVGEDYFGLRLTADLVAGQREYELPSEIMARIKYIEAKLDGENWSKLVETDLLQYEKSTDEATILSQFANRDPAFDLWDKSFFLYSGEAIISVEDGIKLWAIVFPADFTDLSSTNAMDANPSSVSHGFPREFHGLLAIAVSIAYKTSQTRPIPLSEKEKTYEADLADKLEQMKEANLDRNFVASIPYNDGSQY
jgi:hypothetical protein